MCGCPEEVMMSIKLTKKERTEAFVRLLNSCEEGYTGTWDPSGEGAEGFIAMYDALLALAYHYKIDVSEAKKITE